MVDINRSHINSNSKPPGAGHCLGHRPAPARKCVLNEEGCLDLKSILDSFNGPINEEQAWALCYQTAQCMRSLNENTQRYVISDAHQLLIQKEGSVHPKTVIASSPSDEKRRPATSESKLISTLGVVLFQALDYGFSEDEERALDPSLEVLIERLTSADGGQNGKAPEKNGDQSSDEEEYDKDSKDEGIERDSDILNEDEVDHSHQKGLTVGKVIEMCVSHLSHPDQAESHYRAVCRALVAEALELSTFLEKISLGTKELRKSSLAAVGDFHSKHEVVATLDDLHVADWARLWMQVIRQLRLGLSLKKVDFSQGQHPIEYELTPYEMLLDDIRYRRYKLRQVMNMACGDLPALVKKDAHTLILEFIRSRPPLVPASQRTLAPPPTKPQSLRDKLMHSIKQKQRLKPTPPSSDKEAPIHLGRICEGETLKTKPQEEDTRNAPKRRLIKPDLNLTFGDEDENKDGSTPESRSPIGWTPRESNNNSKFDIIVDPNEDTRDSVASIWSASDWGKTSDCLSLTLEEVQHIRSALTKAEIDSLGVTKSLRDDLEKGRICFTCLKIRFSFFGPWPVRCKLCERSICERCSTKMHIPTEQFANIPVHMLSPKLHLSFSVEGDENETSSLPFFQFNFLRKSRSKKVEGESAANGKSSKFSRNWTMSRADILRKERMKCTDGHDKDSGILIGAESKKRGPLMKLCRDCKLLVRHIIDVGYTNFEEGKSRTRPKKALATKSSPRS